MVDPLTAGAAVLTGIKLVKQSVDFVKTQIQTCNDIGDIIGHIDNALNGEQQVIKDRDKKNIDYFSTENVAREIIDAKLAAEAIAEMRALVNMRFPVAKGPSTWDTILMERKRRIDKKKQAIREQKAKRLKQRQEIEEYIKYGFITLAVVLFIAVAIGITFKFVLAHPPEEGDIKSCKLYEPKYFLICLNEGRGYADTQLYLDYKKIRNNWIEEDDIK